MNKLKKLINSLPKKHKGLLLGLFISIVALFLPWYSDIDSFGSGINYSAVTGPASLIGISMFALNLVTLGLIWHAASFKKESKVSRSALETWAGPAYLYAGFILFSIYFHSDFGLNVTSKSISYGLVIGAIGGVITTYSAFMFKDKDFSHVNPETVEDVLVNENPELRESWEKQKELEQRIMDRAAGRVINQDKEEKSSGPISRPTPQQDISAENAFGNSRSSNDKAGSFMYRRDL